MRASYHRGVARLKRQPEPPRVICAVCGGVIEPTGSHPGPAPKAHRICRRERDRAVERCRRRIGRLEDELANFEAEAAVGRGMLTLTAYGLLTPGEAAKACAAAIQAQYRRLAQLLGEDA